MNRLPNFPPKGILQLEELKENLLVFCWQYIFKTSVYPREHEELKHIREATINKYGLRSIASVPVDEGLFLTMLMKIMNRKKTLEIGVFTGYSLLATALGLADDAQVTAIDTDKEAYEIGLPFIRKAGVDRKINFINSDAESVLTKILDNNEGLEEIDFAFVDAEKHKYKKYHEPLLKLVKAGGIIAYDNTLFFGLVAQQENTVQENLRIATNGILELNEFLANDSRIEISQISIGDGLTLCRRL
ncbi:caffeoyl-CoA O-methyltransferase-like isoform X2 [Mercurialis annua]|uniref:caffeoyl-CoA O-methyltransferase-like isoform X2 n=1 Tax=Mercurialis annua TaxID=3986 RepID=UPI0024ADB799|nr:caffeoyl-CoA O-methyltransferase-like isoform X2 [Mercurialis annua]XP_055961757.1 caffeoyl-CoA O-methyltransferase-like isoform X2 [Mercurialis annua]